MEVYSQPSDQSPRVSSLIPEGLRDASMKAAGYAYLVGDAALFASGMLSGRHKEAVSGLLWGGSGGVMARYGSPSAETKLNALIEDLGDYLKSQNVEIPQGSQVNAAMLHAKDGVVANIEKFFYKHPSEVANALYAIGGVTLVQSGMGHKKYFDAASGALVTAGGLAGLLIHEREADEPKRKGGMWAKVCNWAEEKPLRVSGMLYGLNNITLGISAFKELKAGQNTAWLKFATAASYMFGNVMLSITSKENMSASKQAEQQQMLVALEDAAAQVVAAQPKEVQQALIQRVAGYLASKPGVSADAESLAADMQARLNGQPLPLVAANRISGFSPTQSLTM